MHNFILKYNFLQLSVIPPPLPSPPWFEDVMRCSAVALSRIRHLFSETRLKLCREEKPQILKQTNLFYFYSTGKEYELWGLNSKIDLFCLQLKQGTGALRRLAVLFPSPS